MSKQVIPNKQIFPKSPKEAEREGLKHSSDYNKNTLFPSRLRELRKNKGVSQAIFAKGIGVTKSTASLYEQGDNVPDIKTLAEIADYYEVSYDYLMGKSDVEHREYTDIAARTGLSEAAIRMLERISAPYNEPADLQSSLKRHEMARYNPTDLALSLPEFSEVLVEISKIENHEKKMEALSTKIGELILPYVEEDSKIYFEYMLNKSKKAALKMIDLLLVNGNGHEILMGIYEYLNVESSLHIIRRGIDEMEMRISEEELSEIYANKTTKAMAKLKEAVGKGEVNV